MKPEAAYQLKEVTRLNPTFTGAFYYLGMYYASLGRYQEAEAELRKSIQANPQCELCRQSLEKIKSLKR
jgi:tetratricopeptide (TPR) repeat protein